MVKRDTLRQKREKRQQVEAGDMKLLLKDFPADTLTFDPMDVPGAAKDIPKAWSEAQVLRVMNAAYNAGRRAELKEWLTLAKEGGIS